MIDVQNLTKRYGDKTAVDHISFSIQKGEIVGFLGPNGAGKSTTMKILSCYLPASEGSAKVAGYDVFTQSLEVRRNIGYMPENYPFYPELRVKEYLKYRAALKKLPRSRRKARLSEVMEQCWITDVQGKLIRQLSKGYRQRVALAETLLAQPPILILDEPTVGLDPNQIRQARQLIQSLARQHTVILSTHILPEVEMICDRAIIINKGRIVADDSMENLRRRAREDAGLYVEMRSPSSEEVHQGLAGVAGVKKVFMVHDGDVGAFRLEVEKATDPREAIYRLAVERQWGLLELRRDTLKLEDIFVKLVLES